VHYNTNFTHFEAAACGFRAAAVAGPKGTGGGTIKRGLTKQNPMRLRQSYS